MAQKTIVQLIDDLDGTTADENIAFAVDGVEYTIDLNTNNAQALRAALERYVENAQRVGGRRKSGSAYAGGVRQKPGTDRAQNQAIRDWARSVGMELADRGRISQAVVEQFNAAHH